MVLKWLDGVALSRLCIYLTLKTAFHTFVCLCFCVSMFLCICVSVYLYLCEFNTPWCSSGWMVLLYPASVSTSHFGPRSILLCVCVSVYFCFCVSVFVCICICVNLTPLVLKCCFIQPLYLLHTLARAPYLTICPSTSGTDK